MANDESDKPPGHGCARSAANGSAARSQRTERGEYQGDRSLGRPPRKEICALIDLEDLLWAKSVGINISEECRSHFERLHHEYEVDHRVRVKLLEEKRLPQLLLETLRQGDAE